MNQRDIAVRGIFTQAVEIDDERQRSDYLAQACGADTQLRRHVEDLIQANAAAGAFLGGAGDAAEPAVPNASAGSLLVTPITEKPGDMIGPYKLLQQIGEGGCGVVYMAEQEQPVRRKVALKVIKLGMDTKSVIARFEAERQALALMEHPNIARVLDAGATNTGRPYFVMELVRGLKITEHCDQYKLPTAERLNLFIQVCQAIQHAHQKGIIHRDIKPSNIMVTLHDGVPVPKVIDFGIAKATQGKLTDQTLFTAFEQLIGTPAYMSPEQAEMSGLDIDTRSDVYALGVLLYELLTGQTPFDTKDLMAAGLDAMRRTIREKDPSRPSTRLRTMLAADLTAVAKQRQCEPAKLVHLLGGDLDWVVMKALEKDRTRRYETASGLAMEIRRYLAGDPVIARPITPVAQAWRWCRRNPSVAALGVSLILVFALGFMGTLWQWQKAKDNAKHRAQDLYDSDMSLAQHAWDEGDLGRTLSLLEAHLPRTGEADRRAFEWFYFWSLCKGDQRMTLTGHGEAVHSVALSPDGKYLATGSVGTDDPVRIWDTATGKIDRTLPKQNVLSLAFNPIGQVLGVGGRNRVVVWDLQTGQSVFKKEEAGARFHIAFLPRGTLLVIGKRAGPFPTEFGSTQLWDYVTDKLQQDFPESSGCFALSPGGHHLATGCWDKTTKIWDSSTGQLVRQLSTGWAIAMALSPDSRILATSDRDNPVTLWDVTTGSEISSLTNDQHDAWTLAFSPDGRSLATGGADQTVRLYDVATGSQIDQLKGHGGEVMSVVFSADGQMLASGSKDKKAMIWNIQPHRALTMVSNVTSRPIFSPDSRLVAASVGQDKVVAWDVSTLEEKALFAGAFDPVAFSPDGRSIMTRGTNYFLRTYDVATQAVRQTISRGPSAMTNSHVALSPDGAILATGWPDGTLTFCDAKTGAGIAPASHAYSNSFFKLVFSPNGKLLATAGRGDGTGNAIEPMIWDGATHEMVKALAGHTELVMDAAFAPDGKTLLTCGADDSIRFWDTTSWKEIPPYLRQKESVSAVAISPNGRTLATACTDGTVKLWNVATHKEVASLESGGVQSLAFSPDSRTLAAFEWDHSLHLWRAPDSEIDRH